MFKQLLVTSVFLLVLATALSCGSAAPPSVGSGSPQPSAAQSPAAQPTVAPAAQAYFDLAKVSLQATYKAVYKTSTTASGQTMTGEQTWYVKPPKKRIDISGAGSGQGGSNSTYILEDGTYNCTAVGSQKTCFKIGKDQPGQQAQGNQTGGQVGDKPEQIETTYQGARQIAGQQAQCYVVKPKAGAQVGFFETTICYSAQGVPLLTQNKGTNFEMTMEATSVSSTVTDADLELPAKPVEMPQNPGLPSGIPSVPGRGN